MSASDAAPLPRLGEVFFDVRGESRTMRLSWYADTGVAVFSIWQGGTCTGTFRLPLADLPRMIRELEGGPAGRAAATGGRPAGGRDPAEPGERPRQPDIAIENGARTAAAGPPRQPVPGSASGAGGYATGPVPASGPGGYATGPVPAPGPGGGYATGPVPAPGPEGARLRAPSGGRHSGAHSSDSRGAGYPPAGPRHAHSGPDRGRGYVTAPGDQAAPVPPTSGDRDPMPGPGPVPGPGYDGASPARPYVTGPVTGGQDAEPDSFPYGTQPRHGVPRQRERFPSGD